MKSHGIFIFRRDLRVDDNTGLLYALQNCKDVIPCFIFDPLIMKNYQKAEMRFNFLIESLNDLNIQLNTNKSNLHIFSGKPEEVIKKISNETEINSVFVNGDYTQYSIKRDSTIEKFCKKNDIIFEKFHDYLLHIPDIIRTNEGSPYTIFTPFFKRASFEPIRKPIKNQFSNYSRKKISFESEIPTLKNQRHDSIGGRKNALFILTNLKEFLNYNTDRNIPSLNMTTRLSAHNRFGTCSIREVYQAIVNQLGVNHQLISELHWRDFFTYILFHFPHAQNLEFKKKYQKLTWSNNKIHLELWKNGMTGFPIVDAGMRELNQTGFMHNRVRMIVASFLTKDLHLDWKEGARYFAEKLIDYDPAVNNGNWQWAASTGCDAVPYFRIFNPWIQQKKYDSDCTYIKKWVNELRNLTSKEIHNLEKISPKDLKYPRPMINHSIEAKQTIELFKKIN